MQGWSPAGWYTTTGCGADRNCFSVSGGWPPALREVAAPAYARCLVAAIVTTARSYRGDGARRDARIQQAGWQRLVGQQGPQQIGGDPAMG